MTNMYQVEPVELCLKISRFGRRRSEVEQKKESGWFCTLLAFHCSIFNMAVKATEIGRF